MKKKVKVKEKKKEKHVQTKLVSFKKNNDYLLHATLSGSSFIPVNSHLGVRCSLYQLFCVKRKLVWIKLEQKVPITYDKND